MSARGDKASLERLQDARAVRVLDERAPGDGDPAWSAPRQGVVGPRFAFGVARVNMDTLSQISVSRPLSLDELKFHELFSWPSSSLRRCDR